MWGCDYVCNVYVCVCEIECVCMWGCVCVCVIAFVVFIRHQLIRVSTIEDLKSKCDNALRMLKPSLIKNRTVIMPRVLSLRKRKHLLRKNA